MKTSSSVKGPIILVGLELGVGRAELTGRVELTGRGAKVRVGW